MGDEDDGGAGARPQLEQFVGHQGPGLHVERGERLVHEQDLRVVDEGGGERDALALAAGQLVRVAVLEGGQADPGQPVPGPLLASALGTPRKRGPAMTLDSTVRQGKTASCWKTKPTSVPMPRTGSPPTRTSPSVGSSRPLTRVSVVDLPQPVGPTTATNSPRPTVRSSSRTAVCSAPDGVLNALLAPRSSMAGLVVRWSWRWTLGAAHGPRQPCARNACLCPQAGCSARSAHGRTTKCETESAHPARAAFTLR